MSDPAKVKAAVRPNTKLVWMETPSNPMLKIFDIAAIAQVAKDEGSRSPSTTPSPRRSATAPRARRHDVRAFCNEVSQRALRRGRRRGDDSDDALAERLRFLQKAAGAVPSRSTVTSSSAA